MCALITHYKASPIQAEQQGEGQAIIFLIRHVVIRCRDRQWRPFFSIGQTLCIKGSGESQPGWISSGSVCQKKVIYKYL